MSKKIEIEETSLKIPPRKSGSKKKNSGNFWTKNNKKNLKIIVLGIVAVLLIFAAVFATYYINMLNQIKIDEGKNYTTPSEEYVDDENFDAMYDIGNADSLNGMMHEWATNSGEKMHSRNVLNILLLGLDSKDGKQSYARSDAMILVSVNKTTKEVTLTSFYRDSYTYMKYDNTETYAKLNAAFFYGGPQVLIETIENNYKIEIDNYVSVDFKTFPKLIDALGGVDVEVQEYEKNFINRTTKYTIESGKSVNLSGNEALVFSRIRKCDSDGDVSRTRRQRMVIQSIIDSAKGASISQINKALNAVLPYVTTDITKSEIVSLAAQALSQDWMNYPRTQQTMPKEEETGWSAMISGQSVWVVDYPVAAYNLQKSIYGKSNIILSDDRRSAQDLLSSRKIDETTESYNNYDTTTYYYNNYNTTTGSFVSEYNTTNYYNNDTTTTTNQYETTTLPESTTIPPVTESTTVSAETPVDTTTPTSETVTSY